ncbi:MAG: hypothetical protein EXR24_06470, partial [Ignavibacteria bacterium]|nr:hypothetical protein [Ignavibacteria bacterium]
MKKIFLLCMLVPLFGISQNKNITSVSRYFPKVDKVLEFEKAIAAHAQKYHTGDWKWRVWDIQSGPDASGYQITEGPLSWELIDSRGEISLEHNNDWNKSVAIYLTDRSSASYSVYQDSLSTVALTDYSDKININHLYPKIGWGGKVYDIIKTMKKVWQASGESVAVFTASSSGPSQYSIITRYKQGLKERATDYRKPFKERYEATNGEDSYDDYLEVMREYIKDGWSELLSY